MRRGCGRWAFPGSTAAGHREVAFGSLIVAVEGAIEDSVHHEIDEKRVHVVALRPQLVGHPHQISHDRENLLERETDQFIARHRNPSTVSLRRSRTSLCWWSTYVIVTYMTQPEQRVDVEVRDRLIEAEAAYRRARRDEYIARQIRDEAIVDGHRAGLSSREIGALVGGMDQANVVRARRRASARRADVPAGALGPADAVRRSGLTLLEFVEAVRAGTIEPLSIGTETRVFRPEDVDALRAASRS